MSGPIYPPDQPPPPPPTPPAKKKSKGKIFLIVAIVLIAVCAVGGFVGYKLLSKAVDVAYAEGNCLDVLPTSTSVSDIQAKPVSCTDAKAAAKILKVADGKTLADGDAVCGPVAGAVSYIEIPKTDGTFKLLCLGPA